MADFDELDGFDSLDSFDTLNKIMKLIIPLYSYCNRVTESQPGSVLWSLRPYSTGTATAL